jgi:iron complex outermembrane recepter protein
VELGYRGDLSSSLSLDLSTYYGRYDDLRSLTPGAIVIEDGQPIAPVLTTNKARGHSGGGTLALNWRPVQRLRLRGSYTFLDMTAELEDSVPPGTVPNLNVGFSPEHMATLSGSVFLGGGLETWVGMRYVSALRNPEVRSFVEADARLAWTISSAFTVAIVGQDLFHERHAEFAGGTAVPRRGELHVTWRF